MRPVALPEIVQDLERIVGLATALAIVERWPGVHVHIPKEVPDDPKHWLIQTAGRDGAQKIIDVFCGETIVIPRCVQLLRSRRDHMLVEQYSAGKSARDLALEFGVTERHVWRILADGPADERQLDLFDMAPAVRPPHY